MCSFFLDILVRFKVSNCPFFSFISANWRQNLFVVENKCLFFRIHFTRTQVHVLNARMCLLNSSNSHVTDMGTLHNVYLGVYGLHS